MGERHRSGKATIVWNMFVTVVAPPCFFSNLFGSRSSFLRIQARGLHGPGSEIKSRAGPVISLPAFCLIFQEWKRVGQKHRPVQTSNNRATVVEAFVAFREESRLFIVRFSHCLVTIPVWPASIVHSWFQSYEILNSSTS